MSILGTRVLGTEDPGFLSRGAVYTEDVQDARLAGACYLHFVRSTVAHAKINSVDISAAIEGDGVIAVFTAADIAADGVKPAKPTAPFMNQAMPRPRWPATRCGSWASRSPWWSPRSCTRARTRSSWSTWTTSSCPRSST